MVQGKARERPGSKEEATKPPRPFQATPMTGHEASAAIPGPPEKKQSLMTGHEASAAIPGHEEPYQASTTARGWLDGSG